MKAIDCCKQEWTTRWNELKELYQKTVRTIKMNGNEYQTDGSGGVIDLGTVLTEPPSATEIETTDGNVQTNIDALQAWVTTNTNNMPTRSGIKVSYGIPAHASTGISGTSGTIKLVSLLNVPDGITVQPNSESTGISLINTTDASLDVETEQSFLIYPASKLTGNVYLVSNKVMASLTQLADGRDVQTAIDALQTSVDSNTTDITNLKESALGGGIDIINVVNEKGIYGIGIDRKLTDGTVGSSLFIYGDNGITIEENTSNSAMIGITDAPASEVNLTDGRDVQTAIDAIEDEIGDEDTAGSIIYNNAQAFKQFLISTETDGDTNQTTITLDQYRTTDFTDTPTGGNVLTVGDGLAIDNTTGKKIISNAGVTSIIAGDNITVDNSTGAVTISASASGSTLKILNLAQNVSYGANDQATSTAITNATATRCYPVNEAISLHTSGNWYIFNFAEITSSDSTFDNMYLVADSLSNLTNLAAYCPHIPDNISFEGNLILDGCYFYKNGIFTQATDQPVLLTKSNGVVTITFNSTDDDVPIYYTATGIISMGFLFSNVYSVYDA